MNGAIIGCGAISRQHIHGIIAAGGRIAALCDTDSLKAEAVKDRYGLDCPVYTDYKQTVDRQGIDVVHICTPHYLHTEMVEYALRRNVHVLCEKPACISRNELLRLKEAVKNSSAQLGLCLQNRYNDSVKEIRKRLEGRKILGAFGTVAWRRFGEYYTASDWRGQLSKEGGSALINQSIHTLDLLLYLVGTPDSVTACTTNLMHGNEIDTEDTFYAVYQGEGLSFQLFGTTASSVDFPASITIITDEFRCTFDGNNLTVDGNVVINSAARYRGKEVWGGGHERLIKDFYDCLCSGRKFGLDLEEGSKSLKCIFAAYESDGKKTRIGE